MTDKRHVSQCGCVPVALTRSSVSLVRARTGGLRDTLLPARAPLHDRLRFVGSGPATRTALGGKGRTCAGPGGRVPGISVGRGPGTRDADPLERSPSRIDVCTAVPSPYARCRDVTISTARPHCAGPLRAAIGRVTYCTDCRPTPTIALGTRQGTQRADVHLRTSALPGMVCRRPDLLRPRNRPMDLDGSRTASRSRQVTRGDHRDRRGGDALSYMTDPAKRERAALDFLGLSAGPPWRVRPLTRGPTSR